MKIVDIIKFPAFLFFSVQFKKQKHSNELYNFVFNLIRKPMFTKENGKTFVIVLAAVMVGLVVHAKVVQPRLVKKA